VNRKRVCRVIAFLVFGALGSAGAAADEMVVAPAAFITAPTGPFHWGGFYVGLNGGYAGSSSSVSYGPNDRASQAGTCGGTGRGQCIPNGSFQTIGPLIGGQVGYNWQINPLWIAGLEADYQWANFTGSGTSTFHLGNVGAATSIQNMVANQTVRSFGTIRARAGWVIANPLVFYGTAGLAFGQVNESANTQPDGAGTLSSGGFSYVCVTGRSCFAGSSSKTLLGYTAGGGFDYALTSHLIFSAEVLYLNLGVPKATITAQNVAAGTTPASFTATFGLAAFAVARGVLSYKF
jgi:outer membrane immunogenic protein